MALVAVDLPLAPVLTDLIAFGMIEAVVGEDSPVVEAEPPTAITETTTQITQIMTRGSRKATVERTTILTPPRTMHTIRMAATAQQHLLHLNMVCLALQIPSVRAIRVTEILKVRLNIKIKIKCRASAGRDLIRCKLRHMP
jgi:hypothetical protein